MKYASSLNVLHEDVLLKIFASSVETSQRNLLAHSRDPKSIRFSTKLVEEFLRHCRPATQNLQDTFRELKDTLYREGFPVDDETIDEEVLEGQICEESYQAHLEEVSHVEALDETFDEDEVLISSLPLDENIHASAPPTHQ